MRAGPQHPERLDMYHTFVTRCDANTRSLSTTAERSISTMTIKYVPGAAQERVMVQEHHPAEARVLEYDVEEPAQQHVAETTSIMPNETRSQEVHTMVVSKPDYMSVDCTISDCEIIQENLGAIPFLLCAVITWNFLVSCWYYISISQGMSWIWLCGASPFAMYGLFLLYVSFCDYFNSNFITITSNEITVEVRPLPWCCQRPKCVPMESIQEICCVHRQGENSITFEVQVILRNGSCETLRSYCCLEDASFIKQEIEKFLPSVVENNNNSESTSTEVDGEHEWY